MERHNRQVLWMVITSFVLGAMLVGTAKADDCDTYAAHRTQYMAGLGAGMEQQLHTMASQRDIPVEAAAFYWAGSLMQAGDQASLRSLAQLTLATGRWPGQSARAERTMIRIFEERQGRMAGLLAGLLLSDGRGEDDPYRARAYLAEARDMGHPDAAAFLTLFEACRGRTLAMQ